MKMNGQERFPAKETGSRKKRSIANPDVADAPAITVPEPLPLPDAGFAVAGIDHIGRAAAI